MSKSTNRTNRTDRNKSEGHPYPYLKKTSEFKMPVTSEFKMPVTPIHTILFPGFLKKNPNAILFVKPETPLKGGDSQQDLVYVNGNPAISFFIEDNIVLYTPRGIKLDQDSKYIIIVAPTESFKSLERDEKYKRVFNFGDELGNKYKEPIINLLDENLTSGRFPVFYKDDLEEIKEEKKFLQKLKIDFLEKLEKYPSQLSFITLNGERITNINLAKLKLKDLGYIKEEIELDEILENHSARHASARPASASAFASASARPASASARPDPDSDLGGGNSKKTQKTQKTQKRKKNNRRRSTKSKKTKKSKKSKKYKKSKKIKV